MFYAQPFFLKRVYYSFIYIK